jgi:sugar O-acyltransferase (sialic acid O-acetyltransferase NeuD family)
MKLALIGGGGLAKEAAEIALLNNFTIAGYFSDIKVTERWKYLGSISDALSRNRDFIYAFCIGAINSDGIKRRRALINNFKECGLKFVNLVSPYAVISDGVRLGSGVIIAHGAVLSVDAIIEDFCLLNTNTVIGHDAYVGSNSVLAPLSFIAGNVRLERDVLIAPNACILEGRTIGAGSVVGTSSSVYRDIKPGGIVMPVITKTLTSSHEVDRSESENPDE